MDTYIIADVLLFARMNKSRGKEKEFANEHEGVNICITPQAHYDIEHSILHVYMFHLARVSILMAHE